MSRRISGWESPCSVTISLLRSWFQWSHSPSLTERGMVCTGRSKAARPVTPCHFIEHKIHMWSTDFSVDLNFFLRHRLFDPTNPGDISCSQTHEWEEGSELSNVLADVCSPHAQLELFIPTLTFCSLTIVVWGPLSRNSWTICYPKRWQLCNVHK